MNKNRVPFLIIIFIFITSNTFSQDTTESRFYVEKADSNLLSDKILNPPPKYSPLRSMALSALLPGAGQFYCDRKARAGVFLGAEIIIGSFAINRYYADGQYRDAQKSYLDSYPEYNYNLNLYNLAVKANDSTSTVDSLYGKLYSFYDKQFTARSKRKSFRHFMGWGTGIYITNILDALASSNYFYDDKPRKPGLAAGLSAIPCLGLGQIYNGSYQKTGVLLTTQTMLLYMAFDKIKQSKYCLDKRTEIRDLNDSLEINFTISKSYEDEWTNKYNSVIKDRNMYLWYFVLFYFYGIFDAAVDAHLHDKRVKIRLTPLADPEEKTVSMNLSLDLKSRRK